MTPSKTVSYKTTILKFAKKGEKSGWTYIDVPADVANRLYPGNKKSFRVKGKLDSFPINGVAVLPMGNGDFILPVNLSMRKGTGKREGAMLKIQLEADHKKPKLNSALADCLAECREELTYFNSLTPSHQNYFSKWVDGAKTEETKAKRIARILNALSKKMDYGQMIRAGI